MQADVAARNALEDELRAGIDGGHLLAASEDAARWVREHPAELGLQSLRASARAAGVAPATLLDAVSKGSGDSFALRNHARKSMLPRDYPAKSFPPEYVLKDIGYVLELLL